MKSRNFRCAASIAAVAIATSCSPNVSIVLGFTPRSFASRASISISHIIVKDVVSPEAPAAVKPFKKSIPSDSLEQKAKKKRPQASKKPKKKSPGGAAAVAAKGSGRRTGKKAGKPSKSSRRRRGPSGRPVKDLKLGSTISGKIQDIADFGAFVQTKYAIKGSHNGCALLHISQIQEERVENIRDVLKVGQMVHNARVIAIDHAKNEVSLSLRKQRAERKPLGSFHLGDEVEGRVDSITPYGAFIDVGCKVNALLHVSRITQDKVENIRDHFDVGDKVTVHIIDIDRKKKTMAASMLDGMADEYMDRRRAQLQRRQRIAAKNASESGASQVKDDKTNLDFFEDAVKDLEEAFGVKDFIPVGSWAKRSDA